MVEAGADTFWEVSDPSNALLSPYDNVLINSYCHAWSCTPTYLVRQFGVARSNSADVPGNAVRAVVETNRPKTVSVWTTGR
jgi:hypothetical protein